VDSGRLALWGRCHRSVLTPGGGLIDECRDAAQLLTDALVMRSGAEASLTRCCITPIAAANTPASIPEADGRSWCHLLNEPLRQCLGQRHRLESFFSSPKTERTARKTYRSRDDGRG
jgi:hypothetical protein